MAIRFLREHYPPYNQITPRQQMWVWLGALGVYLLIATVLGTYWVVGSYSDSVEVDLSGHGDVWMEWRMGFGGGDGTWEAPRSWTGRSYWQRRVSVDARTEVLRNTEPGTVTGCRILVDGRVVVRRAARDGAVRCAVDLGTLRR